MVVPSIAQHGDFYRHSPFPSGADGANDIGGAFNRSQVDGTPGTADMPVSFDIIMLT